MLKNVKMYFNNLPYDPEAPTIKYHSGILTFSGKCIPSSATDTWLPIIAELEYYCKNNNSLIVNFKFDYYNTSTSFWLIRIFNILDNFALKGYLDLNWYYYEIDEDMFDCGLIFKDMLNNVKLKIVKL
jgi:hypothetical protein